MIREFHLHGHRGDPEADAWCALLEGLGVDPSSVPSPSTITYDEASRRLTYEVYALDEDGRSFLNAARDEVVRGECTLRLDRRPVFPGDFEPIGLQHRDDVPNWPTPIQEVSLACRECGSSPEAGCTPDCAERIRRDAL